MSIIDRIKTLEISAASKTVRCPACRKVIRFHVTNLIDVHTGERLEHWHCSVCQIDALTGRAVIDWHDGIEPPPGAIVCSMPPGAIPTLPAGVPIPEIITHWIAPTVNGNPDSTPPANRQKVEHDTE